MSLSSSTKLERMLSDMKKFRQMEDIFAPDNDMIIAPHKGHWCWEEETAKAVYD
jgi:hypothetical protein